jgi:hypothetical protein
MASATFETDLTEIITQAVEAAAMIGSLWSSFGVVDLARSYYNLYNAQRQFYYSTFQQGAEAPLAVAVYNTPLVTMQYAANAAILYGTTGVFGDAMGNSSLPWYARHSQMFGAAPATAILSDEVTQDQFLVESQWTNVMFRFSEVNFDLLSEQRWDHRMKLHNVALKQMSTVLGGLASAVELREDNMTARASNFADMANSLAQRHGLVQGHREVQQRYASLANSSNPSYTLANSQGNPKAMGGVSNPYSASTYPLNSSPAISYGRQLGQTMSTVN